MICTGSASAGNNIVKDLRRQSVFLWGDMPVQLMITGNKASGGDYESITSALGTA
jgi:hypothetical protein